MKRQTYSYFDGAHIAGNLALSKGNLLLQTAIACDNARMARSSASVLTPSNVEFLIYSPNGSKPTLTGKAMMLGIALQGANLNGYVGSDALAYGYSPGDGKLYCNGSAVATLGAATYGDYIGVIVDPQNLLLTVQKNGKPLGSPYTLPAVAAWYFAATVSGTPGAMAALANAGATPTRYAAGNGWSSPRVTIEPIYLGTEPFISQPTDDLAHQKFNGDIDRQASAIFSRGVSFWPWGASAPTVAGSSIQLDILDPNRQYDDLLTQDVRDLPVTFSRVAQGEPLDTAEAVYDALLDRVEPLSDQKKRLYLKDKLVIAQNQLTRPLFPPTVDVSVAGKPIPIAWGICRTYAPPCYDTNELDYACNDAPLAQIGIPRIQGSPIPPGGYTQTADGEGIHLTSTPSGKVTNESSSFAGTFSIAASDYLGGIGNFATASLTGGIPNGWTAGSAHYQSYFPSVTGFSVAGSSPNQRLHAPNYGNMAWLKTNSITLKAWRSYAFQIKLTQVPPYGPMPSSEINDWIYVFPAQIVFGYTPNPQITTFPLAVMNIPTTGTFIGVFTNTTGADQPFVFAFLSNAERALGAAIEIESLFLNELPPLSTNVPLAGPGLDASLRDFLISHGPYDALDYDPTGAQAIDSNGYQYGLYVSESETPSAQACCKQLLDSATADIFVGRDGKIRTVQLFAPESFTGAIAGSLTVTDFDGFLIPSPDNAENLTTRLSGARNYSPLSEADFAPTSAMADRVKLTQPYQWTVVGSSQLSPRYAAANFASALGTCLDVETHGQAEIDRVTAMYSVPRNFYRVDVFTPPGREIEIGDVWNVTYPTGALVNGQNLLVVGLEEKPSEEITTVHFWGL